AIACGKRMPEAHADALVFFGATGDLAYQQVFPALQALTRRGHLEIPVIGVAKPDWTTDQLRARARDSVTAHGGVDEEPFAKLAGRLSYVAGDYQASDTFDRLHHALGSAAHPVFYLAIPPSLFGPVATGLAQAGCAGQARLVVEKPFGRDLASAQALNQTLHAVFAESAIYRIDHFLGKEPVQNLLYFRFATGSWSPSGTATTSTMCRSRWLRTSESAGVAASMRRSAPSEMCSKIICSSCSRCWRWRHQWRTTRRPSPMPRSRSSGRFDRCNHTMWHAVSTVAIRKKTGPPPARRLRRTWRRDSGSTMGGGPVCRS